MIAVAILGRSSQSAWQRRLSLIKYSLTIGEDPGVSGLGIEGCSLQFYSQADPRETPRSSEDQQSWVLVGAVDQFPPILV
jgi:hypothetical protein